MPRPIRVQDLQGTSSTDQGTRKRVCGVERSGASMEPSHQLPRGSSSRQGRRSSLCGLTKSARATSRDRKDMTEAFKRFISRQHDAGKVYSNDLTDSLYEAFDAGIGYQCTQSLQILLHCPLCNERHIDEGEFATKSHHTHACQSCGHVWRPAIWPTTGVRFLPGFKNE